MNVSLLVASNLHLCFFIFKVQIPKHLVDLLLFGYLQLPLLVVFLHVSEDLPDHQGAALVIARLRIHFSGLDNLCNEKVPSDT